MVQAHIFVRVGEIIALMNIRLWDVVRIEAIKCAQPGVGPAFQMGRCDLNGICRLIGWFRTL